MFSNEDEIDIPKDSAKSKSKNLLKIGIPVLALVLVAIAIVVIIVLINQKEDEKKIDNTEADTDPTIQKKFSIEKIKKLNIVYIQY